MKIGESVTELDFAPCDPQQPVSTFPGISNVLRQMIRVNTQFPPNGSTFQLQEARCVIVADIIQCIHFHGTKYPHKHVKKVHADIA